MKALVFDEKSLLRFEDRPVPKISNATDVLIRVSATGICGTDIHILKKDYPAKNGIILGHETSGVIQEIGDKVTGLTVGQKVILDPTYHCGVCSYCRNNRPNYCAEKHHTETGVSHDGTFAEYHVADAAFLYSLPDTLSFEEGTLAEPLACALNGLRQTRISHESRVLIVGAGPLGMLFGLACRAQGCDVTMGDIDNYRIGKARELFDHVQDYRQAGILKTNGRSRYDIIVDTSGRLLEDLLQIVDRGGDIVMTGLDYTFEAKIKPSFLTDNGIRIIGSIDTNMTFAPAINMLVKKREFKEIITHVFTLQEYEEAFAVLGLDLKNGWRGNINGNKVVIKP